MATIASLIVNVAADISELKTNLDQGVATLDQFAASATSTIAIGTALGNALTAGFGMALTALEDLAGAVPDLIEHTITLGNQIFEMSMKTGASVENLSSLRYVASQTGMDFESLTTSFFKVETALGSSGPKADKLASSLENVGLSMESLKNERPDEAFIEIVSALENVGNAADRNALAMQLFGRGAKEMAGLFHEDIYAMMQDAQDLGLVMSTDQAAAAHAAAVGWESFTMQIEAVAMKIAGVVLPALIALQQVAVQAFQGLIASYQSANTTISQSAIRDTMVHIGESIITTVAAVAGFAEGALSGFKAVGDSAIWLGQAVVDLGLAYIKLETAAAYFSGNTAAAAVADQWGAALNSVNEKLTALKGGFDSTVDVTSKVFATVEQVADTMSGNFSAAYAKASTAITDFAAKSKAAGDTVASSVGDGMSPALKKFQQAMEDLSSAGNGWRGTLDTIDGSVVEAIKYYLAAGVAQNSLATAYGLTAVQVKAVASETRDETEATTKATEAAAKFAKATAELSSAGNGWQGTLDTIDGSVVEAIKYYLQAGVSQGALATAYGLTAAQVSAVASALRDEQNSLKGATSATNSLGAAAEAAAMTIQTGPDTHWIEDMSAQVHTLAGEWLSAADAKKQFDQGNTLDLAHAARDPEVMAFLQEGWSLENAEALKLGHDWGFQPELFSPKGMPETTPDPSERVPGYLFGGDTGDGGLSMLHPGEFVVPKGGALVSGGGGAPTAPQVINLVVDGRVLASIVNDQNTKSMRANRKFPAA